jgi:hypothetical protein
MIQGVIAVFPEAISALTRTLAWVYESPMLRPEYPGVGRSVVDATARDCVSDARVRIAATQTKRPCQQWKKGRLTPQ